VVYDVAAQRAKSTHDAQLSCGLVDGAVRTWRLDRSNLGAPRLVLDGRGLSIADGHWSMTATAHGLVGVRLLGQYGDVWLFDWNERWSQVLLRLPGAALVTARPFGQQGLTVGDSLGRLFDLDLTTHAVTERAPT
jgi:hypothetical protein